VILRSPTPPQMGCESVCFKELYNKKKKNHQINKSLNPTGARFDNDGLGWDESDCRRVSTQCKVITHYPFVHLEVVRVSKVSCQKTETLTVGPNPDFLICSPECLTVDYCVPLTTKKYSSTTVTPQALQKGNFCTPYP